MVKRPLYAIAIFGIALLGSTLLIIGCSDSSVPTSPEPPDDSDDGGSTVQFDSEAPPGDSARAFLSDRQFTILALEVDYMEGYEPTEEALDSLKTSLEAHVKKSSIHLPTPTRISAEGEGPYSDDQIRTLEEQHRDHYTRAESDTIRAYFLVVDGKYTDENVVGIAY